MVADGLHELFGDFAPPKLHLHVQSAGRELVPRASERSQCFVCVNWMAPSQCGRLRDDPHQEHVGPREPGEGTGQREGSASLRRPVQRHEHVPNDHTGVM